MLYSVFGSSSVVQGLSHPEGVTVGRDGTAYAGGERERCTASPRIGKKVDVIANPVDFCLGITLDEEEIMSVCDGAKRANFKVQQNGQVTSFAESVEKRPFRKSEF
jgi:hypothetical protein